MNTSVNPIAYLGCLTKLWTLNATVDNVLVLLVKHTRQFRAISFIISSCNFTNCLKSVAVYFISIHLNKCSNIRNQWSNNLWFIFYYEWLESVIFKTSQSFNTIIWTNLKFNNANTPNIEQHILFYDHTNWYYVKIVTWNFRIFQSFISLFVVVNWMINS